MARTTEHPRSSRRRRLLAVAATVTVLGLGAAGTAVAAPATVAGTPCSTAARACVDLGTEQAWLIKDGEVVRGPVAAAHGAPGYDTPRGDFSVLSKDADHRSAEYDNAPMPWSVFFAPGGVAIHEGNTSTPSAGCVRLSAENAKLFFESLQVGDPVEVH